MSFQRSSFQNSAFQVVRLPEGTVLTKGGSVAHNFSRKRYEEFMAAWRAQEAVAVKASEETGRRKVALETAAVVAAEAIRAAEAVEAAETASGILRLTSALEAAASAKRVKAVVEESRAVSDAAMNLLAEMEDEEDAILLLLH